MNEGLDFIPLLQLGKIGLNGIAGLVGLRKNRYIRGNLWFSYDRVLRVGPAGPALFYYLNLPCPEWAAGAAQGTGRIAARPGLNPCK
ncbi:hypothetical protein V1288_002506 [Bradyrhizobium sp. AZCC 2176]